MSLIGEVKEAIRHCRDESTPARASDVKEILSCRDNYDATDLLAAYERAKKHGEIYEYPSGGTVVVKITDDVL